VFTGSKGVRTDFKIDWVPATPEYILTCIQEEWRQCAIVDDDAKPPTFDTTIQGWRDELDLVWWSRLGYALNKQWGTEFSQSQWFAVLVPASTRTLRDVCLLLATATRRPSIPSANILGHESAGAGVFLAVRSLLLKAGARPDPRPSSELQPYLRKWPKVFLSDVSRLVPGGLPFEHRGTFFDRLVMICFLLGALLLIGSAFNKEPFLIIAGVVLFALGWLGGLFGATWFPSRLKLPGATTFRGLAKLILAQQQRSPDHSPVNEHNPD